MKTEIQTTGVGETAAHTPGPHFAGATLFERETGTDWETAIWANGQKVGTLIQAGSRNRREAEGNAGLFAAAAELLGVLKEVLSEADFGDEALAEKCRTAIAKAEGRAW